MKIAIIGAGKVGKTLARGWVKAGYQVIFGLRDVEQAKGRKDLSEIEGVSLHSITDAVAQADVLVLAVPAAALSPLSGQLKGAGEKIIIDPTNSFPAPPEGFSNCFDAIARQTACRHIVKAFNNTGYENMACPNGLDTFVAGDSDKAKTVARQLAIDLGFAHCYDFGGSDKAGLLEQLALCWINLAYFQDMGSAFGLNVVYRAL